MTALSTHPEPPAGRTIVVATDFDRTFTHTNLLLSKEALHRAAELRKAGIVTLLATGRTEAHLPLHRLAPCFDGFVLEGGAVWGRPGRWSIHTTHPSFWSAADVLEGLGNPVQRGWASFSAPVAPLQGGANVRRNRDSYDVTPPGVDKSTGLRSILEELRVERPWILAVGDALNDIPFSGLADVTVAVANAEPEFVRAASIHAPEEADRGFLWAVHRLGRTTMPPSRSP